MPEKPLPELTPEMLLSASACRELGAAQQSYGMPAQRALRVARERPESAAQFRFRTREVEADPAYFDLEALDASPPDDSMDIEFGGDAIEFDPLPERHGGSVGGGRFNVLRPPTREPFRPQIASGPQGGPMHEVGRVGRFAILAEQDRAPPVPREMTLIERLHQNVREPAYDQRAPNLSGHLMSSREEAARQAQHETLPTAWDRLTGEDPYDDDLE
jgi:hypothetical protein